MNIKSQITNHKSQHLKRRTVPRFWNLGFGTWDLSKGFTLIELLLVIVIIGILSTLVVANFIGIRARARDAQRKTDLNQIRTALQLYNSDEGSFPDPSILPGCNEEFNNPDTSVTYMKKLPCDPLNKLQPYVYAVTPTGCDVLSSGVPCTGYTLYACLENTSDPETDEKQGATAQSCVKGSSFTVMNP